MNTSQKKRFLLSWGSLVVVTLVSSALFSSCLFEKEMAWLSLANGEGKIWTEKSDSLYSLSWDGGMFDCVAHGQGKLSKYKDGELVETHTIDAYYGSVEPQEKHKISEGEYYIGKTNEGKFQDFGVYVKRNEVYVGQFINSKPHGILNLYKNGKLYYEGNWGNGAFNGEGTLYKEDGTIKTGTWSNNKLISAYCKQQVGQGFYEGYVLDGKPHGHGTMVYNDGSKYVGEWKNGKWNGSGVFTSVLDTLSGQFDEGAFSDFAKILRKNMAYEGCFYRNRPDGYGTILYPGNTQYSGYWSEGEICGDGEMIYSNGDVYVGEWDHNEFNGWGRYSYASNGDIYEGQWKDGLQDGLGNYISSKFEYKGEWQEGWINGKGTMIYPNGEYYDGDFVENERYGEGTYHFNSGNTYEGEWVDGKFNGFGTFFYADGNYYEGSFRNGKIEGDGTLHIKINGQEVAVTASWDGTTKIPNMASVLMPNGDLYEGELKNGMPTSNGHWVSAETLAVKAAVHEMNEFYKRHQETFNIVVQITSACLTIAEFAVLFTPLAPIAPALALANKGLIAADIALRTTSATIDATEAYESGQDLSGVITDWGKGVAIDAALIVLPKVLKTSPARKLGARLSSYAKKGGKVADLKIQKNKVFGKTINVVKDAKTGIQEMKFVPSKVRQGFRKAKKFTSHYLRRKIEKSKLYADYLKILQKGPIKLSEKEMKYFLEEGNIRSLIETYTGDKKNFQEFFIRLAQGDKNQVKALINNGKIRGYVDNAIRNYGGEGEKHEWLMTSKFLDFLTNPKWGKDGPFLAMAQTKLVQRTANIRLKNGGRHPTTVIEDGVKKRIYNSSESAKWHNELARVIDKCETTPKRIVNQS